MNELDKLEKYLEENGYNYTREDEERSEWELDRHQIIVYSETGDRLWDAIWNRASYGHEKGLLEIMGSIVKPGGDSVEGWLTAQDIIDRLEEERRQKA